MNISFQLLLYIMRVKSQEGKSFVVWVLVMACETPNTYKDFCVLISWEDAIPNRAKLESRKLKLNYMHISNQVSQDCETLQFVLNAKQLCHRCYCRWSILGRCSAIDGLKQRLCDILRTFVKPCSSFLTRNSSTTDATADGVSSAAVVLSMG